MKKKILIIFIVILLLFLVWKFFGKEIEVTGDAKLSWNASEENVKNYNVYYGTVRRTGDCPQGGYVKKVNVGKDNSYKLENLQDGKTYYFSVTSVSEQGKESCFSEEMSKTIEVSVWNKMKSIF